MDTEHKPQDDRESSGSDALKVALITGSFPHAFCGVGDYTAKLAQVLAAQHINTQVITTNDPAIDVISHPNMKVHKVITSWRLRHLPQFIRHLKAIQPDLIHIQYPTRGYQRHLLPNILPIVCQLALPNRARIVSLHEFTHAHWLRKLSLFFLLHFCHKIILPDPNEATAIQRWFPWLRHRCTVIHIGANIEPTAHPRPKRQDADIPYLVYFGFVSKSKDIPTLLQAFHLLLARGARCNLIMITELEPLHMTRVKQLGLDHAVTATGHCSAAQVSHYLSHAIACVLPFRDGVSLRRGTFLAALQHGLPVVTTEGNCLPEGLTHRENVMLTSVGDAESMAQALFVLLQKPELRDHISQQGLTFARRFSWETIGRCHKTLYDGLYPQQSTQ